MIMPARAAAGPQGEPLMTQLRALLGERLSTAAAVREQHGRD